MKGIILGTWVYLWIAIGCFIFGIHCLFTEKFYLGLFHVIINPISFYLNYTNLKKFNNDTEH